MAILQTNQRYKIYPPSCDFLQCVQCQTEVEQIAIQEERDKWKATKIYSCKDTTKHIAHTHPDIRTVVCGGRSFDMSFDIT